MSDPKYGTKASRLRQAAAQVNADYEGPNPLPMLRSAADALKFGQSLTRDQFILLTGAVAAIDRMREYFQLDTRGAHAKGCADHKLYVQQVRDDLLFQREMLTASLTAAPESVKTVEVPA